MVYFSVFFFWFWEVFGVLCKGFWKFFYGVSGVYMEAGWGGVYSFVCWVLGFGVFSYIKKCVVIFV